ncbi:MAG: hypothetical protein J0L56_11705 [Chitinophagales bacterium]|nr:hypothetical protein [Chitinophagales bacterium]
MKLSEFIVLTQEEKRAAVLQEGVAIAQRNIPGYMVFLFQLPAFYVETFCSMETKDIREYKIFHNPAHLVPYLEAIPIEQLLKKR